MIKLIIVDDEEKTRNLIKLLIDKELGITLVGEASNGQEGLELIKDRCPDIVITDIRMPCMDGLIFTEKALKYRSNLMIIMISAYEDFDYARQAIRLGVSDYLLKPIKKSELNGALEKTIAQIKEARVKYGIDEEQEAPVSLIQKVLEYVTQHIGDESLSLAYTASCFYVNPSYLSRIFKSYVGDSFVEYLTKIRIEKAVWYLENTDKKAYEIAELVGISDAAYFGKCFKKYKGVSINHYKKLIKGYKS